MEIISIFIILLNMLFLLINNRVVNNINVNIVHFEINLKISLEAKEIIYINRISIPPKNTRNRI